MKWVCMRWVRACVHVMGGGCCCVCVEERGELSSSKGVGSGGVGSGGVGSGGMYDVRV